INPSPIPNCCETCLNIIITPPQGKLSSLIEQCHFNLKDQPAQARARKPFDFRALNFHSGRNF
ncbi:MAG TPA: hypothetical protein V6C99_09975, partial [Oculatellaceae cyanobacterium]